MIRETGALLPGRTMCSMSPRPCARRGLTRAGKCFRIILGYRCEYVQYLPAAWSAQLGAGAPFTWAQALTLQEHDRGGCVRDRERPAIWLQTLRPTCLVNLYRGQGDPPNWKVLRCVFNSLLKGRNA